MKTQTWIIQYRPEGLGRLNPKAGWYYGTMFTGKDGYGGISTAAVGPFDTAQEACMDLTRAFVTADALGPVEDRED